MPGRDSAYSLTPSQLQQALDVLDRAREAFQIKPRSQRLYRFLRLFVHFAVGAYLSLLLFVDLGEVLRRTAAQRGMVSQAIWGFKIASSVVCAVALSGSVILLLLNLPLVVRIVRERMLLRRLGLKDLSMVLWKAERKRSPWGRVSYWVVFVVGVLALLICLASVFSTRGNIGAVLVFLAFGVTTVGYCLLRRGKEQLDLVADANQLRRWLVQLQERAGVDQVIAVPAEVLEKVARIESAHIARQRAEAVADCVDRKPAGYGVLVARDVSARKSALDPSSRLKVEELIERIAADPRAPEATADQGQGLWRLRTADGEVESVYGIDEPQHQVRLVAMGAAQAESGVGGQLPGDSHA